jgi:1-acyl-sn-glycerol-3-phosphate acyltransferase
VRDTLGPRPNPLPWSERTLSFFIQAPLFFGLTAAYGTLSLISSLWDKSGKMQHAIAQSWGRTVIRISGAKVRIIGKEHLDGRVAVYVANHLSYTDTPVIFGDLPFQFRIVARHELFKLPFIGWHLQRSGQVPVNVSNPRASIASLSSAVRTLKGGMPVFIFPEGGRSNDGHLQEFLNGPAFMAIRAGVPIIPIALVGTYELLPIHTKEFHAGPIDIVVGEPIETKGYSMREIDDLTRTVREAIARLYYDRSYLTEPPKPALPATASEPAAALAPE